MKLIYYIIYIVLVLAVCIVSYEAVYITYPRPYIEEIRTVSEKTNIKTNLIYAVVKAESGFDKDAISARDAVGLMQLTTKTAKDMAIINKLDYNESDLYDPEKNLLLGSYYLKWLLGRYDNEIKAALAAYNAGPGRVDEWLSSSGVQIDYPETKIFVSRVLDYYRIYNRIYRKD
jgi:soluble lytic murein transglycosylase